MLGSQRNERPCWIGVQKEDAMVGGVVPDGAPGLPVSGEDREAHSQLRKSVSQSWKASSALAHWVDVGGRVVAHCH